MSPTLAPHTRAALEDDRWLARLQRALAAEQFVLHFQPIVRLVDGRVWRYEALLRLADAHDGVLVAPGSFLGAAERHGLVREIDRLVLTRVCELLARGELDGGIAMNLSAVSIGDGAMLTHLHDSLASSGADPSQLVIEVTETAAIRDMESARAFCAGAHELGCAVALDDFGTGFGSLQHLKQLPFDYLKIDGEFVRELCGARIDQLVVKALVGLARGLGRQTIAEFVEDRPTVQMLRALGVDYAQGFAVGRPRALLAAAA